MKTNLTSCHIFKAEKSWFLAGFHIRIADVDSSYCLHCDEGSNMQSEIKKKIQKTCIISSLPMMIDSRDTFVNSFLCSSLGLALSRSDDSRDTFVNNFLCSSL